jgi:hypothetical protein
MTVYDVVVVHHCGIERHDPVSSMFLTSFSMTLRFPSWTYLVT